jgi:hypothetical protein
MARTSLRRYKELRKQTCRFVNRILQEEGTTGAKALTFHT